MVDALLHIKLDGQEFTLDELTMGEARMLKRDYGLKNLGKIEIFDPDIFTGLLTCCIMREHPELKKVEAEERVEALDFLSLENLNKPEESPQKPAPSAATAGAGEPRIDAPTGSRATTPAPSGTPS